MTMLGVARNSTQNIPKSNPILDDAAQRKANFANQRYSQPIIGSETMGALQQTETCGQDAPSDYTSVVGMEPIAEIKDGQSSGEEQGTSSQEASQPSQVVIALLGDPGSGKTSLVQCFLKQTAAQNDYSLLHEQLIEPTNIECYTKIRIKLEQSKIEMVLLDTGGDDLAAQMRLEELKKAKPDGFMIFFSIDNRTSFESVERWQAECQAVNETAPIMLVASKVDLRSQVDQLEGIPLIN